MSSKETSYAQIEAGIEADIAVASPDGWEMLPTIPGVAIYGSAPEVSEIVNYLQGKRIRCYFTQISMDNDYYSELLDSDEWWSGTEKFVVDNTLRRPNDLDRRNINIWIGEPVRSGTYHYYDAFDLEISGESSVELILNRIYTYLEVSKALALESVIPRTFRRAAVRYNVPISVKEVEKTSARWSLFPCALAMYRRFPMKGRRFDDWLEPLKARYGALLFENLSVVSNTDKLDIYHDKMASARIANTRFATTAMGARTSLVKYREITETMLAAYKQSLEDAGFIDEADLTGDRVGEPMGGHSPSWIFWDMIYMPDGAFESQRSTPATPEAAARYALEFFADRLGDQQVLPTHMVYASRTSPPNTMHMSNRDGSAGVYFQNLTKKEATAITGNRRLSKSTVIGPCVAEHVEWIDRGLPIEGDYWEELVNKSATGAHYRSDRGMSIEFRTLAQLDPAVSAFMLGRLVLIVSPIVTVGQNPYAQAIQRLLGQQVDMGFDIRNPRHAATSAAYMINASRGAALTGKLDYMEGMDVDLFGENLTRLMRAIELRVQADLLPDECEMYFVESPIPLVLTDGWEESVVEHVPLGGSAVIPLPGPSDQPDFAVVEATVHRRLVPCKEHWLKTNMLLDVAPFVLGNTVIRSPPRQIPIPGILPDWYLSTGGRRHGDANTLNGNCFVSLACLKMGEYIIRHFDKFPRHHEWAMEKFDLPDMSDLIIILEGWLIRGDDLLARLSLSKDLDIHKVAAMLLGITQQIASAAKQEGSGVPGRAKVAASSRQYTDAFPYGFTEAARALLRAYFKEVGGEYFPELSVFGDAMHEIAPIETVLSRLLVLTRSYVGSLPPDLEQFVHLIQDNMPNMGIFTDDENLTSGDKLRIAARRYARKQERKGIIDPDEAEELEEEYINAQIYPKMKVRAMDLKMKPENRLPARMEARDAFDKLVLAVRDGLDYQNAYRLFFD